MGIKQVLNKILVMSQEVVTIKQLMKLSIFSMIGRRSVNAITSLFIYELKFIQKNNSVFKST